MPNKFPQRICILDLETDKTSFKQPEKSQLLFVGVLTYLYSNGRYHSLGHKVYLPRQLGELEVFLKEFRGIVIGHNIFQFDYRVLRPLISLEGIVEKTIDTLVFLHRQKGEFGGLSLRDLARANLKRHRKMDLGQMPGQLWRRGHKKKVIIYNRTDCVVTRMIWQHCITRRKVKLSYYRRREGLVRDQLSFGVRELNDLLGHKPSFTFHSWEQKIDTDGYILKRLPSRR